MDPFETVEEANQKRIGKIIMVLVILMAVIVAVVYQLVKPLPQQAACEKIGWEAGMMNNGYITCYKDCESNRLSSCAKLWVQT